MDRGSLSQINTCVCARRVKVMMMMMCVTELHRQTPVYAHSTPVNVRRRLPPDQQYLNVKLTNHSHNCNRDPHQPSTHVLLPCDCERIRTVLLSTSVCLSVRLSVCQTRVL